MTMGEKYAIGADIGGSHISTVLVNVENGRMIAESQAEVKVNNQAPAAEILHNWAKAIRQTMQYAGSGQLIGIGFAMPGPFDYKNGIALLKNIAKYDNLYGLNVGDELKKLLGLPTAMPFRYSNDALSFAIGECWVGKASAYRNVVAVTLGTGFGSAFLTNGVPVIEGNRVPKMGYVYHMPYRESIADEYFSTRWFVGEYERRTGSKCAGVKEIADHASDNKEAEKLFKDFGHDLGVFLGPVLKTFEAQCLVIGGNISGAYPLFGSSFQKVLSDQQLNVKVMISELMEPVQCKLNEGL
jgi:glucokinase